MIERNCASNIYFTVPSDCSSQLRLEEPDDSAKESQNRRSFAVRWRGRPHPRGPKASTLLLSSGQQCVLFSKRHRACSSLSHQRRFSEPLVGFHLRQRNRLGEPCNGVFKGFNAIVLVKTAP